jgi:[ribosomal protein S5]-alanine N-acetyltransferase
MKLLPIDIDETRNLKFIQNPDCADFLEVYPAFYGKVGFFKPWIGYFVANEEDEIIAFGGFKGRPKNGTIEIAYGTVPKYEGRGIGTMFCKELVLLALKEDDTIRITARTLPEENASTRILKRNGFAFAGLVWDEDDGNVWEWEFQKI